MYRSNKRNENHENTNTFIVQWAVKYIRPLLRGLTWWPRVLHISHNSRMPFDATVPQPHLWPGVTWKPTGPYHMLHKSHNAPVASICCIANKFLNSSVSFIRTFQFFEDKIRKFIIKWGYVLKWFKVSNSVTNVLNLTINTKAIKTQNTVTVQWAVKYKYNHCTKYSAVPL